MTRQMNVEGTSSYVYVSATTNPYEYKYSVWLAGYWEDFTCAYAVAEAKDNQQAHENTHYGNPINSEARLNPYYRWCFVDRDSTTTTDTMTLLDGTVQRVNVIYDGGLVTSDMNMLHNLGSHEHITIDTIRLGQGVDYAGILNSEYPDSNSHSNRFMFGGFAKYNGKEHRSYMMLNPTYSGTGRYHIHSGDFDATAGRSSIYHYGVRPLALGVQRMQGQFSNIFGGGANYLLTKRTDDRIVAPNEDNTEVRFGKMITTAGSYNFNATSSSAYASGGVLDSTTGLVAWANASSAGGKETISAEIESPSGTPFLVVQSVFPCNEIIEGQVFNFAFGGGSTSPFPSGIIGDVDGQWTTKHKTFTYGSGTASGFDKFQYHRLQVGDIIRVAGNGMCIVQEKMLDDYSLILYDFENSKLIDNRTTFDPADASYVGGGAQLNQVPLSRFIYPVMNYEGNLNSKNDGDTFHMRFCPQNLEKNGHPHGRAAHYILKIGFDTSRIDWTENGNRFKETGTPIHPSMHNACVELDMKLGTGSTAKFGDTALFPSLQYMPREIDLYGATQPVPHQEAYLDYDDTGTISTPNYQKVHDFWIDLDVVMDYTNQRFQVFVDSRLVGESTMLPKPSGGPWIPEDLYGWHLDSACSLKSTIYIMPTDTHTYDGGAEYHQDAPALLTTLIDRVGMIYEITKPLGDAPSRYVPRKDSPIIGLDINMTLDKSSTCNLMLADDANDLSVQKIMKDTTSDWRVLLFKDNLDTVYWMGEINSLSIQQNAKDQTKEVKLNATDAINELDRLMPYWEVGQNAYGPSQTYVYRRNEAQMNTENFYLGTRRLMRSSAHLGMDHLSRATSPFHRLDENDAVEGYYAPKFEQRMRLYSSNPIQMYSGEEGYGRFVSLDAEEWLTSPTPADWSDSVWNQWATKRIIGFSDGSRHRPTLNGIPNTNALGRLIIAHCIEHNLKVGDTFKIHNTMGGNSGNANPFTLATSTGGYADGVDITVQDILDKNHFLFSYNGDLQEYGPNEGEYPSFHSVIRRPTNMGGLYYGGAYGYQSHSNLHSENRKYLTQIYRGTFTSNFEDKTVHRFILDGRLMSSFHTSVAGLFDTDGTALSLDYDDRVNWMNYNFSKQFHNYPWSGEPESKIRAGVASNMPSATTGTSQLGDYYTRWRGNGWYKYEILAFKPCAIVRVGAEHDTIYTDGSTTEITGQSFELPHENHDDLATVGPAYWTASHHQDASFTPQGLAYIGEDGQERSQIYTIANATRPFSWNGSYRHALPLDTALPENYERYSVWFRGNDIDQLDPVMPTIGNPHTNHTVVISSSGANKDLTRNTKNNNSDAIPMGPVDSGASGLQWDIHQGLRKVKINLPTLTSGVDGTSTARYTFSIDNVSPNPSPATGQTDPMWDVKKALIPIHGGEIGHNNAALNKFMVFHYDAFDPSTDEFTGCKFAFSSDVAPYADWGVSVSPTNQKFITINIHPVISTAQAVFHPPTGRTSKSRNRVSHALWMQDIRRSNWFKMVFGVIENEAYHHQGPPMGVPAIKGGLYSPHNTGTVEQYTTQAKDFFTLTQDHEAGDGEIVFTPHCGIPMITTDYVDHSVELDAWGLNLRDKGTNPLISIPSKSSNTSPARKNGGLIFEIYTPDGKLDVGIGETARMINCKDSTDPAFTHWEVVRIQQEELQGHADTMSHLGISAGVNTPGPIWITAAHDSNNAWDASAGDFFNDPLGLGEIGKDPDMYHSGDPTAVSGTQGFANINIGDTIFLGNTAGAMLFPPTDDTNEHWNPNNPSGGYRDLISYRWYIVIDKRGIHDICVFPAEYAYIDEDQNYTTSLGTMNPKHTRAHPDFPNNHTLPRGLGTNPHTPSAGSAFPAMGGPVMCKLYCGDIKVTGVKFTKGKHLAGAKGRFRKIRNDFRHIYVLWADMRNDGSADADGGRRKDRFGLMFPTEENYEVNLLYALSQTDITSLKMGEDVDIWQLDSLDPYTGQPWSDNYTNTLTGSMLPEEYLHNWEDKAGSFLIIDSSKFFNLNSYANNGRIGQMSGGKKNLGDIVVQSAGFPELLDNYWWWAMPHPMTAKYRHPYDPSWRTVCRYTTKLTHEIENEKPFMILDSSAVYAGQFYDSLRVEGSHDWKPNSNEPGQVGNTDNIVSGTWEAYGSLVTHYNEANTSDAKRMYFNLGSRIRDADTENTGDSFALTYTNSQEGMNVIKPINDHNIYQNWGATHNLPMMMSIDGYIETPTSNTYWEHDKMRVSWQNSNKLTWLSGGRMPVQYDIGEVPLSNDISTTQQPTLNDAEIDSYGSVVDGRGKTYQRIVRQSQDSSGRGYHNGIITKYHYSIERGKFTYRPCYSSFLTLNRDNLRISQMKMSSTGSADYVRVFFNNGESFVDFPQPSLNSDTQSSKWKMIDAGHIASATEAKAVAIQAHEAGKKSKMKISAQIIREIGQKDLLEGGRHGYISTPCVRQLGGIHANSPSPLHHWSILSGCLFGGRQNALDGNLDGTLHTNLVGETYGTHNTEDPYGDVHDEIFIGKQDDSEWNSQGRGYHGHGVSDPYSMANSSNASIYTSRVQHSYGWYGIGSVDKAIQVVHIPKGMNKVSATTGQELRVIITHDSNTAYEPIFKIRLLDVPFYSSAQNSRETEFATFDWDLNQSEVRVKTNGIIEIPVPTSYGTGSIVFSFNKEYCHALLKYRSNQSDASKSGKGNRVDVPFALDNSTNWNLGITKSFNANSTKNNGSAFPLGLTEWAHDIGHDSTRYRNGYNWLHKAQALFYSPKVKIVDDWVWRPGRTVNYVDNHLDINEQLNITSVNINLRGQAHETVALNLQRDDSQSAESTRSFQLPNLGASYRQRPEPPAPPVAPSDPDGGSGGGSGGGGGDGNPRPPVRPEPYPPKPEVPPVGPISPISPMFPSGPSSGGLLISAPADSSGRGDALGTNMGTVQTHDGESHDSGATGTWGIKSETTVGAPTQTNDGIGAYFTGDRVGINNLTKGAFNAIRGAGDLLGEANIEGDAGLLGVNRNRSSHLSATRQTDFSIQSKSITNGSPALTESGFTLPGRINFAEGVAQSSQDYHEIMLTAVTPNGANGSRINIKAKIVAPADQPFPAEPSLAIQYRYTVYTEVECVETGEKLQSTTNFDGGNKTISLINQNFKGASGINTLKIKIGRVPNGANLSGDLQEGEDNGEFVSVAFDDVKVYTNRKQKGGAYTGTITNKIRAKDNSKGYYSGTVQNHMIGGKSEGDTAGTSDRTNEGDNQTSRRTIQD